MIKHSMTKNDAAYTIQSLLSIASPIEKHYRKQLLCEYLRVSQSYLIAHAQTPVSKEVAVKFLHALDALAKGKPLAYILGKQYFWQHEFLVNEHTLIPRPDTEILIETIVSHYHNSLSKNLSILDLGTGSGCIAITLADEFKQSQVTAIDISAEALTIAQSNANRIGVRNIKFLLGSWFEPLTNSTQKFDMIVSNPPYIDPNDAHLADLTDEPLTALIANDSGMADICHIVKQSSGYLNEHGLLAIEHGYDQGQQVRDFFQLNGFNAILTVKDYGGNDRVTYGIKK